MPEMKTISFSGTRGARILHVEAPGCIVNIHKGLHDQQGNEVTSVEIRADQYHGEPKVTLPDFGDTDYLRARVVRHNGEKPPVADTDFYKLSHAEHATILAALQFYREHQQGEPANRSNLIHELATDNDNILSSLDQQGIWNLFCKLSPDPTDEEIEAASSGEPQTDEHPDPNPPDKAEIENAKPERRGPICPECLASVDSRQQTACTACGLQFTMWELPEAVLNDESALDCPECGDQQLPRLVELGHEVTHNLSSIDQAAKVVYASGWDGDSDDITESGTGYCLECPSCCAQYSLPKGFEIEWQ